MLKSSEKFPEVSSSLSKLGYLKAGKNAVHYGGGFFGRNGNNDRKYADLHRSWTVLSPTESKSINGRKVRRLLFFPFISSVETPVSSELSSQMKGEIPSISLNFPRTPRCLCWNDHNVCLLFRSWSCGLSIVCLKIPFICDESSDETGVSTDDMKGKNSKRLTFLPKLKQKVKSDPSLSSPVDEPHTVKREYSSALRIGNSLYEQLRIKQNSDTKSNLPKQRSMLIHAVAYVPLEFHYL
jgi:hypothetical protein